MLIINKNLISLWIGPTYFLGETVNLLIVLIMTQFVLGRFEGQIQDLSLNIKNKVIIGAACSVLSILLGHIFYGVFNNTIEGLLLGILMGRFVLNISFSYMVNNMLNTKPYLKQYFYLIVFVSAAFYSSQFITQVNSWIDFGLLSILITGAVFLLCFKLILSKKSQNKIIQIAIKN